MRDFLAFDCTLLVSLSESSDVLPPSNTGMSSFSIFSSVCRCLIVFLGLVTSYCPLAPLGESWGLNESFDPVSLRKTGDPCSLVLTENSPEKLLLRLTSISDNAMLHVLFL